MITVLMFIKKWWRETSLVVLVALLGIQAYSINSLNGKLSKSVLERANDQLIYEDKLNQITLETQTLMNQINKEVAEKERYIHEAWTDKLEGALQENEELETIISELHSATDSLLNQLAEQGSSGGSQSDRGVSESQVTKPSSSFSTKDRELFATCVREYSDMAKAADRVIQDFRLLNDWKEVIIIDFME